MPHNSNCYGCNDCNCSCKKTKCCIVAFAPKVVFLSQPITKSFNQLDGETTLFETIVPLSGTKQLMVDSTMSGELVTSDNGVVVTYRLYIDGRQGAQAGFEGETASSSPSLQTCSITFGSNLSHTNKPNVAVKLTGRVTGATGATCPACNFDNTIQSFRGSKGVFLRILVF
jgi:hypothetical protein